MHGQLGVLDQTRLDVVSARNDSEQAGIGCCLVIAILNQHERTLPGYLHDTFSSWHPLFVSGPALLRWLRRLRWYWNVVSIVLKVLQQSSRKICCAQRFVGEVRGNEAQQPICESKEFLGCLI
jgi:hypothetical protein